MTLLVIKTVIKSKAPKKLCMHERKVVMWKCNKNQQNTISRKIMKKQSLWLFFIAGLLTGPVQASSYTVVNTTLSIYGQSSAESTAHLIGSSVGIYNNGAHPWCGNRAYINLADNALFATALAASISGRPVNFLYEDAAPNKTAAGHITFGCKVVSIWW